MLFKLILTFVCSKLPLQVSSHVFFFLFFNLVAVIDLMLRCFINLLLVVSLLQHFFLITIFQLCTALLLSETLIKEICHIFVAHVAEGLVITWHLLRVVSRGAMLQDLCAPSIMLTTNPMRTCEIIPMDRQTILFLIHLNGVFPTPLHQVPIVKLMFMICVC